ncbi:MAG: zinc metallopeptidase [Chitinophagaceae bacterium]|nr:zinc metallopeptidase [Chitinophagaceae bacterium]MCB9044614.1 zinc metallopeptidase [Chitinophagales bacterium]
MGIGYLLIVVFFMVLGSVVSGRLKSKFREYGELPLGAGMSGKEVAEKMLRDNGIYDVTVNSAQGFLSDHYNPADKTVNLSPDVYSGRSIAAAAVAAHECGHAVQHAKAYSMLQFRSAMVPVVKVSTTLGQWVLLAGVGLFFGRGNQWLLLAGIVMFAISTLFSLVTLPVEYDASNRALAWMENTGLTSRNEHDKAKDALKWAARTYVVAALSSVAMLLYYISIFMNRRD